METIKNVIDEMELEFTPLPAGPARTTLIELTQKIGPAWSDALKNIGDTKIDDSVLDSEISVAILGPFAGALGGLIRGITNELTPKYYESLVDRFLSRVHYTRSDVSSDTPSLPLLAKVRENLELPGGRMFSTMLLTESKILFWCLKEQYSDFFGQIARLAELAKKTLHGPKGEKNSDSQAE